MISQAQYSLNVAERVLPLFEKAFGVEYPLPKFDTFVVCSGDFLRLETLTDLMHSFPLLMLIRRLVVLIPVRGVPAFIGYA